MNYEEDFEGFFEDLRSYVNDFDFMILETISSDEISGDDFHRDLKKTRDALQVFRTLLENKICLKLTQVRVAISKLGND